MSRARWIPITEKLPNPNQRVLVCAKGKTIRGDWPAISTADFGWLYEGTFYVHDDFFEDRWVTHWLPLTDLPDVD